MSRHTLLPDAALYETASGHLGYEIETLFLVGRRLLTLPAAATFGEHAVKMALIESFAIHVRNLVDFLYPPANVQPDDVTSEHFVVDVNEWRAQRPAITAELERAKARANKEIAHLTTKRMSGTPPQKVWPVAQLLGELQPALSAFATMASPRRLHPRVGNLMQAIGSGWPDLSAAIAGSGLR